MTAVSPAITIETFDPRAGDADTYRAFHLFADAVRAEELPDDPPLPHEDRERSWRTQPAYREIRMWLARDGERVVGSGLLMFADQETNRHVADMQVQVLPEYRRRGVGRALLGRVAEAARDAGRSLLVTWSTDRVPAAHPAMTALGAQAALGGLISQLDLASLDQALLDEWEARAAERATGFRVEFVEGPVPEDRLAEFAELFEVMNGEPRGDLDVEDHKMTPEQVRENERALFDGGMRRLMAVAVEDATGRMAGFTTLAWRPSTASVVSQWGTGVWSEFRERGLGRLLKAANMRRLLDLNPEARFVRTGNALVNAPMLGINRAMGFKPYFEETAWQVPTERVLAFTQGA